ncbi:MAG: hypothetical protein HY235_19545 [Acidobacteria bacterium]|nr:hypothetical protein [Acidobacteriota bacterium]
MAITGGFLGAGKTSLILAAAAHLRSAGLRAGIITNDQGEELVDTRLAGAAGFDTAEITGGCLCCRFSDFFRSIERLTGSGEPPDIIFAEPVGSCTDLAATVLRPIRRLYGDRVRLAPLTVLVDPVRAEQLLAPGADPHLSYLFQRQIAEADLVCFTKADRDQQLPALPGIHARRLSARTGEGIPEWLDDVLNFRMAPGERRLEIDYQRYAEAEAALGWLNWQAILHPPRPLTLAAVTGPLLEHLDAELTRARVQIAHLKVLAQSDAGYLRAGICANGDEPAVDGPLDAPPCRRHELVVNLRARATPGLLDEIVDRARQDLPGRLRILKRQAFRPAAPRPEHRFPEVV